MCSETTIIVWLTGLLILTNCLLYLTTFFYPELLAYAFNPQRFLTGQWELAFTSIFLHDPLNPWHLISNTLALFFLGSALERHVRPSTYVCIYCLSGIAGNLAFLFPWWKIPQGAVVLGASGAISGLIGYGVFVCPWEQVLRWPIWFPIPFVLIAAIYLLATIFGLLGPATQIAHESHLAGLLTGILLGLVATKRWSRLLLFLVLSFLILLVMGFLV